MLESENSSTEEIQDAEDKNEGSGLAQLAALLGAEESGGQETDEDSDAVEGGESRDKSPPKDLKGLAERLGVEVKDLYQLEIPAAKEGEAPFKLGDLKDLAANKSTLAAERLEWDEAKNQEVAKLTRARTELTELISMLPEGVLKNTKLIEKVQAKVSESAARERQLTLDALPEWKDQAVRAKELEGIAGYIENFGFPQSWLTSAASDHRLMKLLRTSWRREQRINEILGQVKKQPTSSTKGARKAPKGKTTAKASNPHQAQRQQLVELLK